MNPISMVAAITTLILPIDYKTYIDDGLSEKLMRMGYSQEEITHFNREKSKRFIDLELVESYTTTSTIDDKEELIQVGDGKEESLYATESTNDNATVSDGTKTMKTTVSLVKESTGNYKIFLKNDITWDTIPRQRLSDISGIQFDSNFLVSKSNGYPDIETHQKYHYYHYNHVKTSTVKPTTSVENKDIDIKKEGKDTDSYKIDLAKHYIGFEFKLPEDYHHSFKRRGSNSEEKKEYSNFSYSIECFLENT